MGYEYIILAAAIIVPIAFFGVLKGDNAEGAWAERKPTLPGAFGGATVQKSKKKKPKKKSKNVNAGQAGEQVGSDESDAAEEPALESIPVKKAEPVLTVSKKKIKKCPTAPVVTSPTVATSAGATPLKGPTNKSPVATSSLTSLEKLKKQKLDEKLAKAVHQEPLQFASAAAKNATPSSTSSNITSIPGPGAMGNKKKNNGRSRPNAGSGLSHAEFPTLARQEPTPAPAPKTPKAPKQKKAAEPVKPVQADPVPTPESEESSEDDNKEEDQVEEEEQEDGESEDDQNNGNEWSTVAPSTSSQSRSGAIDFSKPMDPWVAQQQQQKLDRIAAADPHGEVSTQFARVLSIKPTIKEQKIREAIPDGFSTQKARSSGGSGSSSYQSAEATKKQRENLAKAAKKKEEKAAMDALQEQRRQDHMRQVKAEKMKEFYRAQHKKQVPVESRWDVPKQTTSSSTVSGGMSPQVNEKGQLIWD